MMVWVYTFEDGTVLKLIDAGLTTAEIYKLQELHHGGAVVIDLIERRAEKEKTCSMCRLEGTENCDECEHPIDDIPSAQQWIPVSSGELPKSHYWVNVTVLDESGDGKSLYASVGWYLSDGMWIVDNEPMYEDDLIRVVAWCELPEPWKGEDE